MKIYGGIKLADSVKLHKKDGTLNKWVSQSLDDLVDMLESNGHEAVSEYVSCAKNKILIDFKCGHKPHEIRPFDYKHGHGCPKCSGMCPEQAKEYLLSLIELNGHQMLSEYKNNKTKILIDYNCGHEPHWIDSRHYKKGVDCPKCAGNCSEQAKEELINLINSNGHIWVEGEYINTETKIHIDFKCGHEPHWISPNAYKNGHGCPICKESKGEKRVRKWLDENNYTYESQKEYDRLIGTGGGNLSYDFYLPKLNILIEYQGLQHERYVKGFHKDENAFKIQQEHDKRKREYAKRNGIELLEIWYWDFENIEEILKNIGGEKG